MRCNAYRNIQGKASLYSLYLRGYSRYAIGTMHACSDLLKAAGGSLM
jgi:hypothetical protein